SAPLPELLQAAQPGGDRTPAAPVGERDLAHVDVAARVDRETVGRDELAQLEPGRAIPQPGEELALAAVDAHARPDVGHVVVDRHARPDLPHVEAALGARLQV